MKQRFVVVIFLVLCVSCSISYVGSKREFRHCTMKTEAPSARYQDSIARYKKVVAAGTSRVIAQAIAEFKKEGDESTLGNMVCDALYETVRELQPGASIDMVIVNRGGLRVDLPEGEWRVQHIYELMPFENEVVIVKIKGNDLIGLLPILKDKRHPIRGMTITGFMDPIANMIIGGNSIDPLNEYWVVTSDYLANGGDGFECMKKGIREEQFTMKVRDAIIHYCDQQTAKGNKLQPYKDGKRYVAK